jgi:hypothetical protein
MAVAGLRDVLEADVAQHRGDQLANEVVVFDHQHPHARCIALHFSHLRVMAGLRTELHHCFLNAPESRLDLRMRGCGGVPGLRLGCRLEIGQ